MNNLPPPPSRSSMIDAWRACACLMVVAMHGAIVEPLPGLSPFVGRLGDVMRHGWLGVPVFFVISGCCLARAIDRRAGREVSPLRFWLDRLFRIYPVYWSALLLACLLAWLATPLNGLPPGSAFPPSVAAAFADLSLTNVWTGLPARLTVSWSLDYEIGFYVLVGVALFPPGSATARLGVYAFITALAHLPGAASWFPLLGYWPQFACGIGVHTGLHRGHPPWLRIAALLYPVALFAASLASGSWSDGFASGFAIILAASLALESRLPVPPRLLVRIGAASFSIYLVHIPFTSPALNLVKRFLGPDHPFFPVAWLSCIALGVVAGVCFHHLVERRIESLRARLPRTGKSAIISRP